MENSKAFSIFHSQFFTFPSTIGSVHAANPRFREDIQASFNRQGLMHTLGASLTRIEPGEVNVQLALAPALTQQNGFAHAAALTAIADTACGYAAFSLAPPGHDVLAVEFKINFLAPARAPHFEARARVIRHGRTLTIVRADVAGIDRGDESLVSTILETVIIRKSEA